MTPEEIRGLTQGQDISRLLNETADPSSLEVVTDLQWVLDIRGLQWSSGLEHAPLYICYDKFDQAEVC